MPDLSEREKQLDAISGPIIGMYVIASTLPWSFLFFVRVIGPLPGRDGGPYPGGTFIWLMRGALWFCTILASAAMFSIAGRLSANMASQLLWGERLILARGRAFVLLAIAEFVGLFAGVVFLLTGGVVFVLPGLLPLLVLLAVQFPTRERLKAQADHSADPNPYR